MVILLFIVVLSIFGRRVVKKLAGGSVEAAAAGVTKYISSLTGASC
jgi:hypothetical protein